MQVWYADTLETLKNFENTSLLCTQRSLTCRLDYLKAC
jgi:hypothetical protein